MPLSADEICRIPLFAGLSAELVEWVASRFETREVDPGTLIASEAASGYTFFVIVDGTATVHHGDEMLATLGPGDFFGEGALLGSNGRRNASVVASSPMRLGAMFGTEFRVLEKELPEVAARVRETMAAREATAS